LLEAKAFTLKQMLMSSSKCLEAFAYKIASKSICYLLLKLLIEKTFLGASPDGLVELDSIIEIKCPFAARNTDIKTAIEKKRLNI
jgi:hypothetical protein